MSYVRHDGGYTRFREDIGRPDNNQVNTGSTTGQISGYSPIEQPNSDFDEVYAMNRLPQKGGNRPYGFKADDSMLLGTGGGGPFISVERTNSCGGQVADTNMNTSLNQPSVALMKGGAKKTRKICSDVKKVQDFSQVKEFWKMICPGAIMIYNKYVDNNDITPAKKKKFLQLYTTAFCKEVDALQSKKLKIIESKLKMMKKYFEKVRKTLCKIVKKSDQKKMVKELRVIEDGHIKKVKEHLKEIKVQTKKKKNKQGHRRTLRQRGGSAPAWSNVAYSSTMVAPSSPMFPRESHLGTIPHTRDMINDCRDNYNHFEGR